jgi:hypothetical protein
MAKITYPAERQPNPIVGVKYDMIKDPTIDPVTIVKAKQTAINSRGSKYFSP